MAGWLAKALLEIATDRSTRDLIVGGTETRDALGDFVGEVAVDIVSSDPTVKNAAAAASKAAVELELENSIRIPKIVDATTRLHMWVDRRRRMIMGSRSDGTVEVPAGVVTPNAGMPIPDEWPYLAGTYDKRKHRFYENVIGLDGRVPAAILEAWGRRFTDTTIASWFARMGIATGVKKTAPYSLTLPAGVNTGFEDTGTDVHQRFPVKLCTAGRRGRVHIRNRNDRGGIVFTGALSMKGIWAGPAARDANGALNGQWAAAPTRLQGAFATAADGSEWVSDWLPFDFDAGKDYMLGVGYTCAAQTNHGGMGGSWRSAYSAEVGDVNPAHPVVKSKTAALDIWVEFEIDAAVPIVAWLGSSSTVGTNTDLPIYDSTPRKHGLAHGVWAAHYAHHGSSMSGWITGDAYRWTKYAGTGTPDAVVVGLGSNDLYNGDTLATAKANFAALVSVVRNYLAPTTYLTTIPPRNASAPTVEPIRVQYNEWLSALPAGAMNCFDFAAAVATPADPSRVEVRYMSDDDVHLNTAGQAATARSITAPLALKK